MTMQENSLKDPCGGCFVSNAGERRSNSMSQAKWNWGFHEPDPGLVASSLSKADSSNDDIDGRESDRPTTNGPIPMLRTRPNKVRSPTERILESLTRVPTYSANCDLAREFAASMSMQPFPVTKTSPFLSKKDIRRLCPAPSLSTVRAKFALHRWPTGNRSLFPISIHFFNTCS
ncbi:hypothetical protein M404DRAFT_480762 [Pisolithus tinctorius Marx 270]|uniref:Uncharacterized protein n=1 Tax=Pisolithus tinctorius Marx 270 TaxID=870435 RepID=A0A0C3NZW6_PISTI|nr:hypothetical protein M404DRAFT_480762 [Pisolithus tinctorius Marx 270]